MGYCDGFGDWGGAASLSSSYCFLYILHSIPVSFSVYKQGDLDLHLRPTRPLGLQFSHT